MQELDKYNSIISSFQALENDKQPYWYVVEWESIEEPTVLKNFTGGKRVTGLDKFKKAVETLQHITNCAKIHVNVYSGQTGKKRLWGEVLKVRDYSNPGYIPPPPLISARKAEPIQQQAQATPQTQPFNGLELLGAILGQPGLSGSEIIPGLLSVRDERIVNRFEMQERDKEIAELKLKNKVLEEKLESTARQVEELEAENESLNGTIDELEERNRELERYIPENSTLGISLSALGSSILNGFVKKVVSNNPDGVAKILGTDAQTLMGVFEEKPKGGTTPPREVPQVSVELAGDENLSPRQKEMAEAIKQVTEWLRSLDYDNISRVYGLAQMWAKDIETLALLYNYATGKNGMKGDAEDVNSNE